MPAVSQDPERPLPLPLHEDASSPDTHAVFKPQFLNQKGVQSDREVKGEVSQTVLTYLGGYKVEQLDGTS